MEEAVVRVTTRVLGLLGVAVSLAQRISAGFEFLKIHLDKFEKHILHSKNKKSSITYNGLLQRIAWWDALDSEIN